MKKHNKVLEINYHENLTGQIKAFSNEVKQFNKKVELHNNKVDTFAGRKISIYLCFLISNVSMFVTGWVLSKHIF